MSVIRSHLIEQIGLKQDHLSTQDVDISIRAILDCMTDQLANGGRVEIRGFGSFSLHFRPSRHARNPKTGEALITAPKHAVHFKPGKELREQIDAHK
jgi:integration host factor subunit beta